MRIAEDIQNMQKTKADKKRKQAQDQAQAIGNPNLLEDEAEGEFRMEVEQDNPEVRQRRLWAPKPKAKAKQVAILRRKSDRNMSRTRKIERKERKNEKNARRKSNRNRAREQGLRKHELSWRERLLKIYEKCAHGYTWHQEERPCYRHRYDVCGEHNERKTKTWRRKQRHAQGEAKEFQLHTSSL